MILLLIACSWDARLLLDVPFDLAPSPPTWTLRDDTQLTLTEASAHLDILRLEDPSAPVVRLSLLPTAWAHPGHDFAGDVGGELLGDRAIDLLAGGPLGTGQVYEGEYATARLHLTDAPIVLAGTYTSPPATDARPFRFEFAGPYEVTSVPFSAVVDEADPPELITLAFDPAHALSFVDWTTPTDGPLTLDDGALANTVPFGVFATSSWSLVLQP